MCRAVVDGGGVSALLVAMRSLPAHATLAETCCAALGTIGPCDASTMAVTHTHTHTHFS